MIGLVGLVCCCLLLFGCGKTFFVGFNFQTEIPTMSRHSPGSGGSWLTRFCNGSVVQPQLLETSIQTLNKNLAMTQTKTRQLLVAMGVRLEAVMQEETPMENLAPAMETPVEAPAPVEETPMAMEQAAAVRQRDITQWCRIIWKGKTTCGA